MLVEFELFMWVMTVYRLFLFPTVGPVWHGCISEAAISSALMTRIVTHHAHARWHRYRCIPSGITVHRRGSWISERCPRDGDDVLMSAYQRIGCWLAWMRFDFPSGAPTIIVLMFLLLLTVLVSTTGYSNFECSALLCGRSDLRVFWHTVVCNKAFRQSGHAQRS